MTHDSLREVQKEGDWLHVFSVLGIELGTFMYCFIYTSHSNATSYLPSLQLPSFFLAESQTTQAPT